MSCFCKILVDTPVEVAFDYRQSIVATHKLQAGRTQLEGET
jgi:hypothetical protein